METGCDVCTEEGSTPAAASATQYCVDCDQKLCERCSKPHKRVKSGPHQLRPISSNCLLDMDNSTLKIKFRMLHADVVHLDLSRVIDELFAAYVISSANIDELHFIQNRTQKSERLMVILHNSRHPNAFVHLRRAVGKEPAYSWFGETLDGLTIDAKAVELYERLKQLPLQSQHETGDHSHLPRSLSDIQLTRKLRECTVTPSPSGGSNPPVPPPRPILLSTSNQHVPDSSPVEPLPTVPPRQSLLPKAAEPRTVHTLNSSQDNVVGLTVVQQHLYILRDRDHDQVDVHSTLSSVFPLRRRLAVPQLAAGAARDLASCPQHHCLFASDFDKNCIRRLELGSGASTTWDVPDSPYGLSVTQSGSVLVTCGGRHFKVVELNSRGRRVRQMSLEADIECPWHAVQLQSTGQLVLCHGDGDCHRVCLVAADGTVARTFGNVSGSSVGRLNHPYHVAVDANDENVLVADQCNHRVVMLSAASMKFVRYVVEGLWQRPRRLYVDHVSRCLYVGQYGGHVTVIQMP